MSRAAVRSDDQLRIAVVLSGGASLGAYQAGALGALLVGVQRLQRDGDERVVVDAMGGASAGSLVSLFGAYALLEGLDPAALLHEAWVERVSLPVLRRRPGQGVLSFDRLRDAIRDFLQGDGHPVDAAGRPQRCPVGVHASLTGLQGLTYPIRSVGGDEQFTGVTYSDWARFVLEPERGPRQILEPEGEAPLDYVLASATHPGAFEPALLKRSGEAGSYRANGIENFPESGYLWYSDGGLVQSQPLGRVLALAREVDERAAISDRGARAVVLIDPRSEDPSGASIWTDPDSAPGWIHGLSRALEILPAQVIYDDAFRVEKMNTRLRWADALVDALEPHLGEGAEDALEHFLDEVDSDREGLPGGRPEQRDEDASQARRLLWRALGEVSGTVGLEPVDVNVITPRLLADSGGEAAEVTTLLAGEFMGDFGGFLDRDVRHSDFLLGYASAQQWLPKGLSDTGFDEDALEAMAEEVADKSPGDWRAANKGTAKPTDLRWEARRDLVRLVMDAVRAFASDTVDVSRYREGARATATKAAGKVKSIRK